MTLLHEWVLVVPELASVVNQMSGSVDVERDRELLRRAIENVVRNAIRYSPENAQIDLTLAETPSGASITVRDYGWGIPEESPRSSNRSFV
jgi:signal transduction histidine kinase